MKLLQKKQKLDKFNFIKQLQLNGFARIPHTLKVSKLSSAFHFYDPVPKMIEHYGNSSHIHRLLPLDRQNSEMYGDYKIVCSTSMARERASSLTQRQSSIELAKQRSKNFLKQIFCCMGSTKNHKNQYFNEGIEKQKSYLIK